MICVFLTISLELIAKSSISISYFSFQYHSCVECFVQFFSLNRLLKHIKQKNVCFRIVCKQCEQNFNFKNKFHDHIREQHIKSNFRFFTSEFTHKIEKKSTIICSSVSFVSSVSSIFFATSTSIFDSISSKCSHFLIATLNITSKSIKKLSINSFTFSISFFSTLFKTSVLKHQKSYFIIDDLIRMFREKFKSFELRQHQKNFAFSQNFDIRSFTQSRFSYQSRIIVYFLFAINQKTSINQNSKSSNSKSFQQFTFAKTIRSVLSEKSIISSYKKSNISYISLQSKFSFLQSKFSFAWFTSSFTFSFTSSFTSSSFFRFLISDHVCCICFDHFNFRNDLFNYSSFNQRYFSNRQSIKKVKKMISRFETKLKKNEK